MKNNRLDFLARMSDDPKIQEAVRKAKLVNIEKEEDCLRVWTDSESWEVRRSSKNNEIYCTCPAFRFNKESARTCKHLTAVGVLYDLEEVPVYKGKKFRQNKTKGCQTI